MADVPSGAQDGGGGRRPRRAAAAWLIARSELSRQDGESQAGRGRRRATMDGDGQGDHGRQAADGHACEQARRDAQGGSGIESRLGVR
jgi:hypothetical protein